MNQQAVKEEPFPAPSRSAVGTVGGVDTEVSAILFSDRILLTISQDGRLSHWVLAPVFCHSCLSHLPTGSLLTRPPQVQVPLSAPSSTSIDMPLLPPMSGAQRQLPAVHLQPKTLLGHGSGERESIGHVYAAHIASHLALEDPSDTRTLVLGLGLRDVMDGEEEEDRRREKFFDVLELVQKVL